MLEGILVAVILGVIGAVASNPLRRRYAIRRALAQTSGVTPSLRAAVRATRDELRPSARNGEALRDHLIAAMGAEKDVGLVTVFLARLDKQFSDRGMEVMWEPPATPLPRPILAPRRIVEPLMRGRSEELTTALELVARWENVAVRGAPGIGKTTLLDAIQAARPEAVYVRLEQGGQAMSDLRLALHRYSAGEFPVDDDQGIAALSRELPDEVVLLVDNADETESARALLRLVGHLPNLTVVVTTRAQSFPGFEPLDLSPLPEEAATAILDDLNLDEHKRAGVLESAGGNPQLLLQEGWAAEEGTTLESDDRLTAVLDRLRDEERPGVWLIGELPSASVPARLLVEVGQFSEASFGLLRRNAVLKPVGDGFEVHQTLRVACRRRLATAPRDRVDALRDAAARWYVEWLGEQPALDAVDVALPTLMHLTAAVEEPAICADLALALIGDHLDDPRGYLPSRGVSGLLLAHRDLLTKTAAEIGGLRAAQIEKNLGLFSYWANDPGAEDLLLSARARYRELGDREGEAAATWILGYLADDRCHYADAEALYRAPLDWLSDLQARAVSHHLVGCSLYHQGRLHDARRSFEQARSDTTDDALLARIERRLAYVELAAGDTTRALEQLDASRKHAQALNRPRDVARISRHAGHGRLQLGDIEGASQDFEVARDGFERLGDERGLGATLRGLAATRLRQGKLEEARELALRSRRIARGDPDAPTTPMPSPVGAAQAEEELGRIAAAIGEVDGSTQHLRRACNLFEAIGHARAGALAEELGERRDAAIPQPKAILFDLVDTLAETETATYENAKRKLSARLGVDHDQFTAAWARSRRQASTDPDWTPADRIRWVAAELGASVTDEVVDELAQGERDLWTSSIELKTDTLDALGQLKAQGIAMALVSNGSSAMRGLGDRLGLQPYLRASLLSCEARVLKPHRGIYEHALQALGLSADECIYVGDGNDRELEGAKSVGLFAVRTHAGEAPKYSSSKSLDWDATVHSLGELIERLGEERG
jgi:putative hydrolase of the HAD superfamily